MKVAAVVLAAGASRRLGEPKQLLTLGGERLLERAVRVAREAGCEPVIVVLGARAEAIRAACRLGDARVLLNTDWKEGMASSLRVGVAAISGDVAGVVLLTCDQPAVTAEHLRRLIAAGEVVGSEYDGKTGVPAYFPAERLSELAGLRGDRGARTVLKGARTVGLPGGELDIDTRESYREALKRYGNSIATSDYGGLTGR